MNRKTYRYLLYVSIGVILYYTLKDENEGESLDRIHEYAPWAILVIVVVLMVMKIIMERKMKDDE